MKDNSIYLKPSQKKLLLEVLYSASTKLQPYNQTQLKRIMILIINSCKLIPRKQFVEWFLEFSGFGYVIGLKEYEVNLYRQKLKRKKKRNAE